VPGVKVSAGTESKSEGTWRIGKQRFMSGVVELQNETVRGNWTNGVVCHVEVTTAVKCKTARRIESVREFRTLPRGIKFPDGAITAVSDVKIAACVKGETNGGI